MNREIKFRAWIERDKTMFYQNNQYLQSFLRRANEFHQPEANGHDSYGTPPLMQYTGLKDKNGKEIYEGDIIDVPYNRIGKQVVEWESRHGQWNVGVYDLKVCAVIGNIYEKP